VTENIAASWDSRGYGNGVDEFDWVLAGGHDFAKGMTGSIFEPGDCANYQGLSYQAMRNLVSQIC